MGGSGPSWESGAAAELVAAPSADSSVDAAADMLGELSGWDTASHGDVFPDTGDSEALALGEGLAATLEDIAAGPRRGANLSVIVVVIVAMIIIILVVVVIQDRQRSADLRRRRGKAYNNGVLFQRIAVDSAQTV